MIQRIQTLYLLISVVVINLLFLLPINELTNSEHILRFTIFGISEIVLDKSELIIETMPLLVLTSFSALSLFFSIFLFKNRRLQTRLVVYSIVVLIGLQTLFIFYLYKITTLNQTNFSFSPGLFLPIVAAFIAFLAFRAIRKDDELVKSADRIR